MGHETLNKMISVPNIPRKNYTSDPPSADMLYVDHAVNPLHDEILREDWLEEEVNSNPLTAAEKDIKESRYGTELGRRAVSLNGEDTDEELEEDDEELINENADE